MPDAVSFAMIALTSLAALIVLSFAGLRAWHEWIDLQRQSLAGGRREPDAPGAPAPAARIEIADLRERVRKLEAIAAGVDL